MYVTLKQYSLKNLSLTTVDDESDDELSTGVVVAISIVVTFIITLVVTALITYVITGLYYKRVKRLVFTQKGNSRTENVKMDDLAYANARTNVTKDADSAYTLIS